MIEVTPKRGQRYFVEFDVVTEHGPLEVVLTDGDHASIHTTGHVNDSLPLINWRTRELLVHVHLYASLDWQLRPTDHAYVSYRDTWGDAAPTAVQHAIKVAREAVLAVVAAYPNALHDAEVKHLNNELHRLEADVAKAAEALKVARTALRKNRTALKALES